MEDVKKLKIKNWKETAKNRRTLRDLAEKAKTHKGLQCEMMMMMMIRLLTERPILLGTYFLQFKGKSRVHSRTGHEGPEGEQKRSSTLSLTSAPNGVGGQRHVLAALPPGKTRYLLYRKQDGPKGRSGQVRKILPPPGFDPRTAQPVMSRYTDYAIPGHY